jgi:methylated-DNA-[protein]-cysteine S-methyltransferase
MCAALWTQKLRQGLPGDTTADGAGDAGLPGGQRAGGLARARDGAAAAGGGRGLAYGACPSPFGLVHLAASADGVCGVSLYESEASFRARLAPARWDLAGAEALLAQAAAELAEYFAGQRQGFDLPLDLRGSTAFDRRVLAAIAAIPYGATRTYGELAHEVGSPGAARAVGRACGRNPAGGPDVKARLLALESGALPL